MSGLAKRLRTVLAWLVAAALFAMMTLTFLDVVGRYLINRPFPGATELVQYTMIVAIFLALPVVTYRREHISISLVDSFLGPPARKLQRMFVGLVSAIVLAMLSYRLWLHAEGNAANRDVIGFLDLPVAPAAYLASLFCGVTVLVLVAMIVSDWRDVPRAADDSPGAKLE